MMVRLLAIVAALLCTAMSASAHRLDEYLQAARIELTPGSIVVQLRLTPGVSVAPLVASDITSDNDAEFSAAGQRSYAETVRQDLSLTLDGHSEPLRLVSFHFPAIEELTAGTGDIELRFAAELRGAGPDHRLDFANRHARAIAVYLVSTLLPRSPGLRIVRQDRSYDQFFYRLDFSVGAGPEDTNVTMRRGQ